MASSRLSLKAWATGPDLTLTIYFNNLKVWQQSLGSDPEIINHEFDDIDDTVNVVEIEMSGKSQDHTKVDDHGNIVEDRCIEIRDLCLDDIELGNILSQKCKYSHDFNGTKDPVEEKFWGTMGCNGRVRFEFSSPVYLWLLENL